MLALYYIPCLLFIIGALFLAFDARSEIGAILLIIAMLSLLPVSCLYIQAGDDAERKEYIEGYNSAITGKGIGVPIDSDGTSAFERGFKDGIGDVGTPENARF